MNIQSKSQNELNRVSEKIQKIVKKFADGDYLYRGEPECYSKVSSSLYGENPEAEDFDIEITERTCRAFKARSLFVLNLKGTLYGEND